MRCIHILHPETHQYCPPSTPSSNIREYLTWKKIPWLGCNLSVLTVVAGEELAIRVTGLRFRVDCGTKQRIEVHGYTGRALNLQISSRKVLALEYKTANRAKQTMAESRYDGHDIGGSEFCQ